MIINLHTVTVEKRISGITPRLLVAVLATVLATGCADSVLLRNQSGAEVGALISGKDAVSEFHHRGYLVTASKFRVGRLERSSASNEVIGFTIDRPPKLTTTPWTEHIDVFNLDFRPRIEIPVTIWIVKGPFLQQRDHAYEACIATSIIWRDERMGVDFGDIQVVDATTNPLASSHFSFPNGDVGDHVWKPLRDDIGFASDRLNIYWVNTVNGSPTNGWSNFGAQVVMGYNSGEDLLVHEIGHAFSLQHTYGDGVPDFDINGIMARNSATRQYITEGELFRAHLDTSSVLNSLYQARPGELTRSCGLYANTSYCPPVQRRLWADGVFPPD